MGGRGSALWWRAILLATVGTAAWLTGCTATVTPEERTGHAEGALNDLSDDMDPTDPVDPADTGCEGDPGGPSEDPEPQPWVPANAGTMHGGASAIHDADDVTSDDPEPQPWRPDAPGDEQQPSSSSSSSTKQP